MKISFNAKWLRHLLVLLALVAGQSLAFAHGVDEASHPAKTVCDLCIAGHPLGAAVGGADAAAEFPAVSASGIVGVIRAMDDTPDWFTPGQRAPPVSP